MGRREDCGLFENWLKKKENWKELPGTYAGKCGNIGIWLFLKEGHLIEKKSVIVLYRIWVKQKFQITKVDRIDRPPILDWDLVVGFFDGASQERGEKCGAGAVLKCPEKGTYKIMMNCGKGD
jgi:hypothetical protein